MVLVAFGLVFALLWFLEFIVRHKRSIADLELGCERHQQKWRHCRLNLTAWDAQAFWASWSRWS
jgi:hypothetical protein